MRVSKEHSGIQLLDLALNERASLSPLLQLEFRYRIKGLEAERAERLRAIFWASILDTGRLCGRGVVQAGWKERLVTVLLGSLQGSEGTSGVKTKVRSCSVI